MTIAVIVPTLNRDPAGVMACVAAQTYPDVLGILVCQSATLPPLPVPVFRDTGRNEFTPDLTGYPRWIGVHVPWQRGNSVARNLGIQIAAQFDCAGVVFWDDDDTADPATLACLWALSTQHPVAETVACDVRYADGTVPGRDLYSIGSRLWRMDRSAPDWGVPEFDDRGPAQDHRFWRQFGPPDAHCGHVHYQCGEDQSGGLRDPSGRF